MFILLQNAHDGPLFSIFGGKDVYLTGGRDEKIKKWDANFESPEETQVLDAAIKVQLQSITALGAASTYQVFLVERVTDKRVDNLK